MHSNLRSVVGIVPLQVKRPPVTQRIAEPHVVPHHVGPGPLHSDTLHSSNNSRRIIFVGGHAALNTQPIPPGHVGHRPPHPVAPLSDGAHR